MKIEFDRQEFLEDDNAWDCLFVRIDGGNWHMAIPHYGTEDEEDIRNLIDKNTKLK